MKKLSLLFITILIFTSCSVSKKPVFIKIGDIKLSSFTTDTLKLKTSAFFKNENDVGGKFYTEGIDVFIDGKPIGKVKTTEFKVPARKEFEVPMNVIISNKKVFNGKMLSGILSTLLGDKKITVRFKGDMKYKVLGFKKNYPVDKTEVLKIN